MTPSSTIKISSTRIISWMNALRNTPDKQKYRLLECFWESQLTSKSWLINTVSSLGLQQDGDVYIFGGWYGILASLIRDEYNYDSVHSIDIDPNCQFFTEVYKLDQGIKFITHDMKDFTYPGNKIGLIINTSTEHIRQETFNMWMKNVPNDVPVILQGNNFYDCEEHIRCTETLDKFKEINPLGKYIYSGELICYGPTGPFTRFMTIGYKNAN